MKRLLFLFIILLLTISSFAQENNKKKKKQKLENIEVKTDKVSGNEISNDMIPIRLDDEEASSLNLKISKLQSQVKSLRDDSTQLSKQIQLKNDTIQKLIIDKSTISSDLDKYKEKYDKIVEQIIKMDAVVYKQCLLYPLEARYNETSIQEALDAVEAFAQLIDSPSEKFADYRKVYEPLLKNYSQYNKELIESLKSKVVNRIKLLDGELSDSHKESLRQEIEKLKYYQDCYKDRNKPPYKSIIYLDDAIDKFLAILEKKGKVEKDIEDLIKSLEPKPQITNQ